jgi:hypothetical protein
MSKSEKCDMTYLCLGGVMLLVILFGILVLDRGADLSRSQALKTQNGTPLSTEQFWQHLPG